jgi:hypothetical protein
VQAAGPGSTGYDPAKQDAGKYLPASGGTAGFVRAGKLSRLSITTQP